MEWIQTDDLQWVKPDNETNFEVINVMTILGDEDEEDIFVVSEHQVCLGDYKEEDLLDEIRPFGYKSLEEVKMIYGPSNNQILAECVAENEATNGGGKKLNKKELQQYLYTFHRILVDM